MTSVLVGTNRYSIGINGKPAIRRFGDSAKEYVTVFPVLANIGNTTSSVGLLMLFYELFPAGSLRLQRSISSSV